MLIHHEHEFQTEYHKYRFFVSLNSFAASLSSANFDSPMGISTRAMAQLKHKGCPGSILASFSGAKCLPGSKVCQHFFYISFFLSCQLNDLHTIASFPSMNMSLMIYPSFLSFCVPSLAWVELSLVIAMLHFT